MWDEQIFVNMINEDMNVGITITTNKRIIRDFMVCVDFGQICGLFVKEFCFCPFKGLAV